MSDRSPAAVELQTARLLLRRPTAADVDAIFAVHRDPETCIHNPSDALARFEEAEALYQRWDNQWQQYGYGYWVVRHHGSAQQFGFCGIKPMELHGAPVLNLFYRFATSAWGQGFAGEAAAAVATCTGHAKTALTQARESSSELVHSDGTVVVRGGRDTSVRWWTWAGYRANATLAATLTTIADPLQRPTDRQREPALEDQARTSLC
jgi:hypothetical protein